MISFSPTEDETHMMRSVAELATATLRPRIRAHEVARELSAETRRAAFDLGLGLLTVPESAGGPGLGLRTAVLLEEEIAAGDAGAAFALAGPGALATCIAELASPSQRDTLLAPFVAEGGHERFGAVAFGEARALPERPGLATTATPTSAGYLLSGTKSYVRNADRAEVFVVFA